MRSIVVARCSTPRLPRCLEKRMPSSPRFGSFREFWPYYVQEHQEPACRALHFAGTTLAASCLLALAITGNFWWLLAAPLCGYGPSWIGHLAIERNRPAAFRYPVWSLRADGKMWVLMATGRMGREVASLASDSSAT